MENRQLDAKTRLTKALAEGAVIMYGTNLKGSIDPEEQVKPAYQKLKGMLQEHYGQINADLLDIAPGSAERQEAIANQLEESGATEDEAVMQQAQAVLDIIYKVDPAAIWATAEAEPPSHLK